ncbi:MAG TPA: hypothetical protein O0Y08_03840 [Methanocorpusculum sp.]|nr:hypothetical protein [Methanocorpusculum sp.]HJJ59976.1 hypothetical protein [Methanocorpusculum sp.]
MPFPDVSKTVHLTDEGIDDILKTLVSCLDETKCESGTSNEVRTGISFVLRRWQTGLGEDTVCMLQSGKRTGRTQIIIAAPGKKSVSSPKTAKMCFLKVKRHYLPCSPIPE